MTWEKIKAAFRHSLTIVWARLQVAAGVVVAFVMALATDPNVTAAVHAALQPKFIPYYVIAIGVVAEIARRRTARGKS